MIERTMIEWQGRMNGKRWGKKEHRDRMVKEKKWLNQMEDRERAERNEKWKKADKRAKEDEEWLRREHEWMTKEQQKQDEIVALGETVDELWARHNTLKVELEQMEINLRHANPPSPPSPLTPQGYEDGGEQSQLQQRSQSHSTKDSGKV